MRWFVLCLMIVFHLGAKEKTICLNMIVKNESRAIEKCLSSVKNHIDYWVIVDTGSTDGTQEIIRKQLETIPGELHERPWKNFGENRQEALKLAKGRGDYLFFIDADDFLEYEKDFEQELIDDLKDALDDEEKKEHE